MKLVDRLLANMEVGVGAFSLCDVRTGHQLTFKAAPTASVHYCLAGQGQIRLRDGPVILVRQHSFVVLPPKVVYSIGANDYEEHGLPHQLLRAPSFYESVPTIQAGDGQLGILSVCGEIETQVSGTLNLFANFDKPLVEQFDPGENLENQFVVLLAESARPGLGARALTEALLKQCLVLLLRRSINRGEVAIPWMTALTNPGLARALQAMLERPSERFTVETLAQLAGMSRSAFAARFSQALRQTPMNLLRSARLRRARELLVTTNLPIAQIAKNVGFLSRSNFSNAFRVAYGVDPRTFRAESFKGAEI